MPKTKRIKKVKISKKAKRKSSTTNKKKLTSSVQKKLKAKKYSLPGQRKAKLQEVNPIPLTPRTIPKPFSTEVYLKKTQVLLWPRTGL